MYIKKYKKIYKKIQDIKIVIRALGSFYISIWIGNNYSYMEW